MTDRDPLSGTVLEDPCLSIEQLAAACAVERAWIIRHVDEGLLPAERGPAAELHFSVIALRRARRMVELERDFDAVPELAALFADLLEQLDEMKARLGP